MLFRSCWYCTSSLARALPLGSAFALLPSSRGGASRAGSSSMASSQQQGSVSQGKCRSVPQSFFKHPGKLWGGALPGGSGTPGPVWIHSPAGAQPICSWHTHRMKELPVHSQSVSFSIFLSAGRERECRLPERQKIKRSLSI